jgi:cobalt/nickel transport system permease protein
MKKEIPDFLLSRPCALPLELRGRLSTSFIDRAIAQLSGLIKVSYIQWETANKSGLLQQMDARIKVLFVLCFILIVSLKQDIFAQTVIFISVFCLAVLSTVNLRVLYGRVLMLGFFFGFLIALPSSLNVIGGGEIILPLIHLARPRDYWIYHIPQEIGITREGIRLVALITLRIMNSLSLSFLLIYTTPFAEILRALKCFKVPDTFLMIMALSYKYVFLFARTLEEMHLAKKGRLVGVRPDQERGWVAGRMVFLFRRTQMRCEEVFKAMLGRGFSGEATLYTMKALKRYDYGAGVAFFLLGIFFLLL